MKQRLDHELVARGLVSTRSQAESYIKLGNVEVNGRVINKAGHLVVGADGIKLLAVKQYVSRAALKLASVAQLLKLNFKDRIVLDVGSSTGGFTQYALDHGAKKVIAVEIGTDQLHTALRSDPRIMLHEKTDIRNFRTDESVDIVLADVSFVSLRDILPAISRLSSQETDIIVMVKPQFEATVSRVKHKGVIKNDRMRRDILNSFEQWAKGRFVIMDKADSAVAGAKGNQERFYLLKKTAAQ